MPFMDESFFKSLQGKQALQLTAFTRSAAERLSFYGGVKQYQGQNAHARDEFDND